MPRVRKEQTGSSSERDEFDEVEEALRPANRPRVEAPPGSVITVTWGEEVIQPIQFNGFRVGPITLSAPVLPGETLSDAYERVWNDLDALGRRQFQQKIQGFKERLREAAAAVRER